MSDLIKLILRSSEQGDFEVEVPRQSTVEEVKKLLHERHPDKPQPELQRLLYLGQLLFDGRKKLQDVLQNESNSALMHLWVMKELPRNRLGTAFTQGPEDENDDDEKPAKWLDVSVAQLRKDAITELDLPNKRIGPIRARILAEGIKSNKSLVSLNLLINHLGHEGIKIISESIAHHPNLKQLDLGCNNIGSDGCKALGDSLSQNKSLKTLSLYNNNIGPEGVKYLLYSLAFNKTLTHLYLGANNLGTEGAKALALIFPVNNTLTNISLVSNNISDEASEILIQTLTFNRSITTLYLQSNAIQPINLSKISAILQHHKAKASPMQAPLEVSGSISSVAVDQSGPSVVPPSSPSTTPSLPPPAKLDIELVKIFRRLYDVQLRKEIETPNLLKTLQTLYLILDNIITHPDDEKFARVPATSKRFASDVLEAKGGLQFILKAGFRKKVIEFKEFWVVSTLEFLPSLIAAREVVREKKELLEDINSKKLSEDLLQRQKESERVKIAMLHFEEDRANRAEKDKRNKPI
eukprot:TRINITY_DN14935_c0_g1_i1.p1 TRINITY_DN14935_c0_g1~~TRINITY_DN14935_c0_g1_i1.p1  ORF type:complete len:523 (+),score=103.03 TRINITY_DN14935_c0_g1_i1:85-1653(+)